MRVRFISYRFWAAVAAIIAAYVGLGFGYSDSNRVEADLFGASHIAVSAVVVVFIAIYTALGLFTPAARWWRNELGTALVLAGLGTLPSAAVLIYISYFHNYQLDQAVPDWIYSSGPILTAIGFGWLAYVWLKERRT